MNTTKRQSVRRRGGSAMILVVVITVLLAIVGVMFVMVARVGEMQTSAVVDTTDLDAAVKTVVSRIHTVLVEDLFDEHGVIGADGPHYTWPGVARGDDPLTGERINPWLASLEPNAVDNFRWEHISNLSDSPIAVMWDRFPVIVPEYQPAGQIVPGHYADAAGDGVADSIWIRLPNASTSRGKPVFAAIRIIDNCAMLNLNTAFGFYQNDPINWHSELWYAHSIGDPHGIETAGDSGKKLGRILGEVNYGPFLRGDDRGQLQRIRLSRNPDMNIFPDDYYNEAIRNIESPGGDYRLFDIGDELEIRNRYLLTSRVLARYEKENVAYDTFDHSRGEFVGGWNVALRVKRVPYNGSEDVPWSVRLNPANFDGSHEHAYYYDRRHISTFYSFDRPLRTGQYPTFKMDAATHGLTPAQQAVFVPDKAMPIDMRTADITDATTVVQLLYALREVYDAPKAAQIVVNLMDYVDSDNEVSFLDTDRIADYIYVAGDGLFVDAEAVALAVDFGMGDTVVYGYERQPFISEMFTRVSDTGVLERFALEIVNPYDTVIDLTGWQFLFVSTTGMEAPYSIPNGTIVDANQRRVFRSHTDIPVVSGTPITITGLHVNFRAAASINLQRLVSTTPSNMNLTVDCVRRPQIEQMITDIPDGSPTYHSSKRDDNGWKISDAEAYEHTSNNTATISTLGSANGLTLAVAQGYQLPVADDGEPIERLADFIKVAFVSSTAGDDPNTITKLIADADTESDIRFDVETQPELLDYICFLNRPDKGSLPGRININTAALHVIAAAIPPQLVMTDLTGPSALQFAQAIVDNRPYQRVSDLLEIEIFKQYAQTGTPNVGDQGIEGDFEERDWIVSRLANIFTVRSDTFTAYILVRLGDDGPQRRMIAIFDRSQVWTPNDRPRLVALHPVPEAR